MAHDTFAFMRTALRYPLISHITAKYETVESTANGSDRAGNGSILGKLLRSGDGSAA